MKILCLALLIVFSSLGISCPPAHSHDRQRLPLQATKRSEKHGKSHRIPMPPNLEHAILTADFKNARGILSDQALINCANAKWQTPLTLALEQFAFQEGSNFPSESAAKARNSAALAFEIWLVQHWADVNVDTGGGMTPLMHACFMRSLPLVQAMCSHGADTLAISNMKTTPLSYTFQTMTYGKYGDLDFGDSGETDAMRKITIYLLKKPVKINSQDSMGFTALDYARGYHSCARILRSHGAHKGSHRLGLLRDGSYVKFSIPGTDRTRAFPPGTPSL